MCKILCRIVFWIIRLLYLWIKVLIVRWWVGGVVIIDRLCILFIVIFSVCGIGVVVSVRIFMFVCIVLMCFLWCILKWCFLLIISRFKFLNLMLFCSSLCVLIRILIFFFVIFVRICVCFLVLWKWEIILIWIG